MADDDDEDYFGGDDIDEDILLAVENAEKHHASQMPAMTSTQHPSSRTNGFLAPLPTQQWQDQRRQQQQQQQQQTNNYPSLPQHQRVPSASNHQARPSIEATTSATNSRQLNCGASSHASQARTVAESGHDQTVSNVPRPQAFRQPSKPIYQPTRQPIPVDDFPDVDLDENGKGYRPKRAVGNVAAQPTSLIEAIDTEKEQLKKRLAEVSLLAYTLHTFSLSFLSLRLLIDITCFA